MCGTLPPSCSRNTPLLKATEVTSTDAKTYRDHLLAERFAPTTINRVLISLMLFFDTLDGINPFRYLTMIEMVEPAPIALSKTEWNAVRRCAEQLVRRDHGLALATLFRSAGLRGRSTPDPRCASLSPAWPAHYSTRQRTQASRDPAQEGKHANHSMPISNTANIWLNAGENEQRSGEK
jgi:hypothetical protein